MGMMICPTIGAMEDLQLSEEQVSQLQETLNILAGDNKSNGKEEIVENTQEHNRAIVDEALQKLLKKFKDVMVLPHGEEDEQQPVHDVIVISPRDEKTQSFCTLYEILQDPVRQFYTKDDMSDDEYEEEAQCNNDEYEEEAQCNNDEYEEEVQCNNDEYEEAAQYNNEILQISLPSAGMSNQPTAKSNQPSKKHKSKHRIQRACKKAMKNVKTAAMNVKNKVAPVLISAIALLNTAFHRNHTK